MLATLQIVDTLASACGESAAKAAIQIGADILGTHHFGIAVQGLLRAGVRSILRRRQ
jgi:hypothetical protein